MNDRQKHLIDFLRECAQVADDNGPSDELVQLLADGDLIRKAADEFETLAALPIGVEFKDSTAELHFNLVRAEQHARQAHDVLYREDAPKRSVWFKMAAGRAQSILLSLYVQEMRRKGK